MKELKKSGFQFTNPLIKKIIFSSNDNFKKENYTGEIEIQYSSEIKNNEKEDKNMATVELQIYIGKQNETAPFYLELNISSIFRWTDDTDAISENLLENNAVILLLSYARPIIAHLTADAGYKAFNIPFANLNKSNDE